MMRYGMVIAGDRWSKEFFEDWELWCRCGCRGLVLNAVFDRKLHTLRRVFNRPMKSNSCCRCEEHNRNVGGNPRSFHVYDKPARPTFGTSAIDIARRDRVYNDELAILAWKQGWSIGVNPAFLHLDVRAEVTDLPQNIFSYGSTSPKDLKHFKDLINSIEAVEEE